ncbi:hypothetical protein QFZ94_000212 [Paraburkholderia sp. JPY465]|uniref:IS66 family insertion sequence element accessory protein TnpA n=1 Tax=Paraburkholderia sp. JPY465 TaxID=3042285 RepID=UPI003D201207
MDRESKRQDWAAHLAAAERDGVRLSVYAREHGLNAERLYDARRRQRRRATDNLDLARSPFATVQVDPAACGVPAKLSATLPNGVTLELSCGAADATLISALITSLARTRCSTSTLR